MPLCGRRFRVREESILRSYFVLALCAAISVASLVAEDKPVPVEQEPYHHVQLKNDDIVVIHAILPPANEPDTTFTPAIEPALKSRAIPLLGKSSGRPKINRSLLRRAMCSRIHVVVSR